jgi:hypothetical protein
MFLGRPWWMSVRRSHRVVSLRNWCSRAIVLLVSPSPAEFRLMCHLPCSCSRKT